jgi:hypothetical protein
MKADVNLQMVHRAYFMWHIFTDSITSRYKGILKACDWFSQVYLKSTTDRIYDFVKLFCSVMRRITTFRSTTDRIYDFVKLFSSVMRRITTFRSTTEGIYDFVKLFCSVMRRITTFRS